MKPAVTVYKVHPPARRDRPRGGGLWPVVLAIAFLVGAPSVLVWSGELIPAAPDRARYPMRGIDVSHHQGSIDWQAVAADDVAFAWIKATEGGDFTDPRFAANWRSARQAGVPRGAYHFFTLCRSGLEQAAHFLAVVPPDPSALVPAVDVEYGGNCAARPSHPAMLAELRAFVEAVETEWQRPMVVYLTPEMARDLVGPGFPDRPIWIRSIWRAPRSVRGRSWTVWQYTPRGRVAGIEGFVDLNVLAPGTELADALLAVAWALSA